MPKENGRKLKTFLGVLHHGIFGVLKTFSWMSVERWSHRTSHSHCKASPKANFASQSFLRKNRVWLPLHRTYFILWTTKQRDVLLHRVGVPGFTAARHLAGIHLEVLADSSACVLVCDATSHQTHRTAVQRSIPSVVFISMGQKMKGRDGSRVGPLIRRK